MKRANKSPRISVVVPAYNEERDLGYCLAALRNQSLAPFEIIVVDNNSTDATARIARSYRARVVTEETQGISYARTAGFDAARGEVIARTDADSQPSPHWIEAIARQFANSDVMAIRGQTRICELSRLPGNAFKHILPALSSIHRLFFRGQVMYGFNMAIRQELWQTVREEVIARNHLLNEDVQLSVVAHRYTSVRVATDMIVSCKIREALSVPKLWRYMKDDAKTMRSIWLRRAI